MNSSSRGSLVKPFVRFFLILLAVLVLFIMALPSLLSTHWGKTHALSLINARISGKVEVGQLGLSWFGPQLVQDVTLRDPKNQLIFSLQKGQTDASFFSFLWKNGIAGPLSFENLNISLLTVALKNVQGRMNVGSGNEPIMLYLSGETQQGDGTGQFIIDLSLKGISIEQLLQSSDPAALLTSQKDADLKIRAEVTQFPVDFLDQLVAYKKPEMAGVLRQLLGAELNLRIEQKAAHLVSLSRWKPNLQISPLLWIV